MEKHYLRTGAAARLAYGAPALQRDNTCSSALSWRWNEEGDSGGRVRGGGRQ
jgi:hypothetical protein